MSQSEANNRLTESDKVTSLLDTPVGGNAPHCCESGLEKSVCTLFVYTLESCACVMLNHFCSTLSVAKTKKQISVVCMYPENTEQCVYCAQIKQWER